MLGIGFFEVLAELSDTDPRYAALSAGLLVLRIAADVLGGRLSPAQTQYARARVAIGEVRDIPQVNALRTLIDAAVTEAAWNPTCRAILCSQLMSYGVRLQEAGHFRPAIDIFNLIVSATDDEDLKLQAIHQQAWATRRTGDLDHAEAMYERLEELASEWHVRRMVFEARLGRAKVLMDRGNFPAADAALTSVLDEADRAHDTEVVAKVSVDLARVAGVRGDPDAVLARGLHALPYLKGKGDERSRMLINMAFALRELGRHPLAIDVADHAARTSESAESKAYSLVLLLNLAVDVADEVRAAALRQELRTLSMTAMTAAEFYEAVSRQHAVFGRHEEALASARRMLAVAEEHHLNEHIIRAERAVRDLERGVMPAIYAFRPKAPQTAQAMAPIEDCLRLLCAAS